MAGIMVSNVAITAMDLNQSTGYSISISEAEKIGKIIQNYSNVAPFAVNTQHA